MFLRDFLFEKSYLKIVVKKITFENSDRLKLSAHLDLPAVGKAAEYAIFAHCFACGKELRAAIDLSRRLTEIGFGVLRFDFTGLGESEGDFAETDFTSNLSDLKAAAEYLEKEYAAPALLVGHSLGGTAVLHVAGEIESVRAVCTIGAPMEATHVLELLADDREEILEKGKAEVAIGGRPFLIGARFIEDLERHSTAELLPRLKKPLLIMHAPQDPIVSIDQAAEIYKAAFHPKSFISLDQADHLLRRKEDSLFAADILASWAKKYIALDEPKTEDPEEVVVKIGTGRYTTEIVAGSHRFLADEPKDLGGKDLGPTPMQLLSAALGACTVITLRMYADRKEWPLEEVTVQLSHEKRTFISEGKRMRTDVFKRKLELVGALDAEQRERLVEIANRCPVHRTLVGGKIEVETELI